MPKKKKVATFQYCKKMWSKLKVGERINPDELFLKAIPKKEQPNRKVEECASFCRIMVANKLAKREVLERVGFPTEVVFTKTSDSTYITTEELRIKTETYYAIQNIRIQALLRTKAFVRDGRLNEEQSGSLHGWVKDDLESFEHELKKDITSLVEKLDIWTQFLARVKGIGPCLAGSLYASIQDIGRFAYVASLWKQAGLSVVLTCPKCRKELVSNHCPKCGGTKFVGDSVRRKKGQKLNHDPFLKKTCFKISESFVRQQDHLYRKLYEEKKAYYKARYPEWQICYVCGGKMKKRTDGFLRCTNCEGSYSGTDHSFRTRKIKADNSAAKRYMKRTKIVLVPDSKGYVKIPIIIHTLLHLDTMAKRYIVKIFLQHLWVTWRKLDNLPVSKPWIIEHGGHSGYIDPSEAMMQG